MSQSETKGRRVNLFKDNRKEDEGSKLQMIVDQLDKVILEVHDVEELWGYCLVGYFAKRYSGKWHYYKFTIYERLNINTSFIKVMVELQIRECGFKSKCVAFGSLFCLRKAVNVKNNVPLF